MNRRLSILKKVKRGAKAGAVPSIMIGILSLPGNYYLLAVKYSDEISGAASKKNSV